MKEELKDLLEVLLERKLEEAEIKNIDFAITHALSTVDDIDLATGKGLANLVVILSEEIDYTTLCLHFPNTMLNNSAHF